MTEQNGPPTAPVGGTKAPFWRLQPQQLQADVLGFLLSRGWSVKIGAATERVSLLQFYRFRKFTNCYQLKISAFLLHALFTIVHTVVGLREIFIAAKCGNSEIQPDKDKKCVLTCKYKVAILA